MRPRPIPLRRILLLGSCWVLGAGLLEGQSARAASQPNAVGYLTTPGELASIKAKADKGIEPYDRGVTKALEWADMTWSYTLASTPSCPTPEDPIWLDNDAGGRILYAKALAYQLTGTLQYGQDVAAILEQIMTDVLQLSLSDDDCLLTFSWGLPELVASADLIEGLWDGETCTGPTSSAWADTTIGPGDCKDLLQNWLAKAYYAISYEAEARANNRGAAASVTTAYIADYLWDRPGVSLIHRSPSQYNGGLDIARSPADALVYANQLTLDRIDGYRVDTGGDLSCDVLGGPQQSPSWDPEKSQITPEGIVTEEARREEFCNVPVYNDDYQNYPQLHLGSVIQQCELMLRRGDRSCYDNVDTSDLPGYSYDDWAGTPRSTHLRPGRGSVERAIRAVISTAGGPWRHDPALEVATQYYYHHGKNPLVPQWLGEIDDWGRCFQDVCWATVSHPFNPDERPLWGIDDANPADATPPVIEEIEPLTGASERPLLYATCLETGSDPVSSIFASGQTTAMVFRGSKLFTLVASGEHRTLHRVKGSVCADAVPVGGSSVGYKNLDSLASCEDGWLYSIDYDFTAQRGQLIRIDALSGTGGPVKALTYMATDLRFVGLSCDQKGRLLGLTSGENARVPEVYDIDRDTGVETLVGATGTADDELQSLTYGRLNNGIQGWVAGGTELYEIDPDTGATSLIGGSFDTLWALAQDPSPVSVPIPALPLAARVALAGLLVACAAGVRRWQR